MRNLSIRKFLSNKIGWLYILSGGLLLGTSLLGLFYSSVTVPVPTILHIILDKLFEISLLDEVAKNEEMIIWNIRLPRVLL
ncbi:MAG TPA: ABC transporter permease, partial [Bacillus sp. (in: firmicutes)]